MKTAKILDTGKKRKSYEHNLYNNLHFKLGFIGLALLNNYFT